MNVNISANQPTPQPRTDPLIIDPLPLEQLVSTQAYVQQHGGFWITLADGGYQIVFPMGTQQTLGYQDEYGEIYHIHFPDGAWLLWWRRGRISAVNGWPQGMSSKIVRPVE